MKKILILFSTISILTYLLFNLYFTPYFEKRNITSFYTFICKLEKEIRIENKKFALIDGDIKWLQKKCFPFFKTPYPDIKKYQPVEEKIILNNLDIQKVKSYKYKNNNDTWTRSHGNNFSDKFSSLEIINKTNLSLISKKWEFDLGKTIKKKNIETNPIYFNNKLILTDINNNLIALNPLNGNLIWKIELKAPVARRGLTGDQDNTNIFVPTGQGIVTIDTNKGKINKNFGKNGFFGFSASLIAPIVTEDKIFFSDINSNIWSFNKFSGKKLWKVSTKKKDNFNGAVNWGGISYDNKRNLLYISTGNPRGYWDYIGITRQGQNLYSNSLIAIDGDKGKIKWHFIDTEHDLWDLDISFPPILSTINYDNENIDIVSVISKSGNILTFEREFGFRIFDYKIQKVNNSLIKEEKNSPYQKVVIKPKNIVNHSIEKNQLSELRLDIKNNVIEQFDTGSSSMFKPPEIHKQIFFNGISGGGQWPGGSINSNGILFAHINLIPWALSIQTKILNDKIIFEDKNNYKKIYIENCSSCHGDKADKIKIGNFDGKYVLMNSLLGISKTKYKSIDEYIASVKSKHSNLKNKVIEESTKYLIANDSFQIKKENIFLEPDLRIFKDQYENFATKGPWGYLIAVDLEKQKIIWKIPSGSVGIKFNNTNTESLKIAGSPNWGGLLTTKSGLIFSTGSYDNAVNFYDQKNGNLLYSIDLGGMGSAPPITYKIDDTQYISIVVTGGGQRSSQKIKKVVTFSLENKK